MNEENDSDKRFQEDLELALKLSIEDSKTHKPLTLNSTKLAVPPSIPSSSKEKITREIPKETKVKKPEIPKRVKALYDFVPNEGGELGFVRGDIIKVLDSIYKEWWRGELRGKTGIFPVNYVEIINEPTLADITKEAEIELSVFAQAQKIDKLLEKLEVIDPSKDNAGEDEEIQELYQSTLPIRAKLIKLIEKYSQKKDDLIVLHHKYIQATKNYEELMQKTIERYDDSAPKVAPHDDIITDIIKKDTILFQPPSQSHSDISNFNSTQQTQLPLPIHHKLFATPNNQDTQNSSAFFQQQQPQYQILPDTPQKTITQHQHQPQPQQQYTQNLPDTSIQDFSQQQQQQQLTQQQQTPQQPQQYSQNLFDSTVQDFSQTLLQQTQATQQQSPLQYPQTLPNQTVQDFTQQLYQQQQQSQQQQQPQPQPQPQPQQQYIQQNLPNSSTQDHSQQIFPQQQQTPPQLQQYPQNLPNLSAQDQSQQIFPQQQQTPPQLQQYPQNLPNLSAQDHSQQIYPQQQQLPQQQQQQIPQQQQPQQQYSQNSIQDFPQNSQQQQYTLGMGRFH